MNERSLYSTWQNFADKNNFEFISSDQYVIGGVITEMSLKQNGLLLIKSKIAKMGTGQSTSWTKLYKSGDEKHFVKFKYVCQSIQDLEEVLLVIRNNS